MRSRRRVTTRREREREKKNNTIVYENVGDNDNQKQ